MDWETLLGLTGLFLLVLGVFVYSFMAQRKLERLYMSIKEISTTNQKILQVVKNVVVDEKED